MLFRTSPWLLNAKVGDIYTVPVSHGEGRFLASEELVKKLGENGQIATQYVDIAGNITQDINFNPNGSICAIEGITSPDGRVFGKWVIPNVSEKGFTKTSTVSLICSYFLPQHNIINSLASLPTRCFSSGQSSTFYLINLLFYTVDNKDTMCYNLVTLLVTTTFAYAKERIENI